MDLTEAIYSRRAIRAFTDQPVETESIRQLIEAAIQAPSAVNEQPWSFTVVRDRPLLDRMSMAAKAHMLKGTLPGNLSQHFKQILDDPSFQIFYHAPVLIVIAGKAEGPSTVIECSLAAENLMLAARAVGLGSCWIGVAQSWLDTLHGRAALNMGPNYLPVAPIIVGHPKEIPFSVPRKQPDIHWIDQ